MSNLDRARATFEEHSKARGAPCSCSTCEAFIFINKGHPPPCGGVPRSLAPEVEPVLRVEYDDNADFPRCPSGVACITGDGCPTGCLNKA